MPSLVDLLVWSFFFSFYHDYVAYILKWFSFAVHFQSATRIVAVAQHS